LAVEDIIYKEVCFSLVAFIYKCFFRADIATYTFFNMRNTYICVCI
jgi:hypothetical protein